MQKSNFQRRAGMIGDAFERMCNVTLEGQGWQLLGREHIASAGIEVDQIAHNQHGIAFYFEYKGSTEGNRPGLRRTDSTKKALCNAFLLRELGLGPFVIITSHLPLPESDAAAMLKLAGRNTVFDVICLSNPKDVARLRAYLTWDDDRTRAGVINLSATATFGGTR